MDQTPKYWFSYYLKISYIFSLDLWDGSNNPDCKDVSHREMEVPNSEESHVELPPRCSEQLWVDESLETLCSRPREQPSIKEAKETGRRLEDIYISDLARAETFRVICPPSGPSVVRCHRRDGEGFFVLYHAVLPASVHHRVFNRIVRIALEAPPKPAKEDVRHIKQWNYMMEPQGVLHIGTWEPRYADPYRIQLSAAFLESVKQAQLVSALFADAAFQQLCRLVESLFEDAAGKAVTNM